MDNPIETLPAADAQSGISVRPITPADTAEICDLLEHGFVGSGIAADDWRPLYTTNWGADNPTRGFVLTDGGRIVGYLGTIYVQREINGKTGIVCNFSGFYVAPAYRGRGLGATLVAAAVRDERHHLHLPHPRPGDTTGNGGLRVCNPRPARVAVPAGAQCRNPLAVACRH